MQFSVNQIFFFYSKSNKMSTWICSNCDLNSSPRTHCQACLSQTNQNNPRHSKQETPEKELYIDDESIFNKPMALNLERMKQINEKDKWTVVGYLRKLSNTLLIGNGSNPYFNIPELVIIISSLYYAPIIHSVILNNAEKHKLLQFIKEQLNHSQFKLDLLYRFSRDFQTVKTFHDLCNNKGATITIIKSKKYNHIFGGYTSLEWTSTGSAKTDESAFLFLLRSSFGHKPRIITLKRNGEYAVGHYSSYGPCFGGGAIGINDGGNNCHSYINESYIDGIKGNDLCGGDKYNGKSDHYYFAIDNYEVFCLT